MIPLLEGGKWGFRAPRGTVLWEAVWDGVRPCGDRLAWVNRGGHRAYDEAEIREDWMRQWCEGGRWGLVEEDRVLIEPTYDWVEEFHEGLAWVNRGATVVFTHGIAGVNRNGGRWGLVDERGAEVLAPRFQQVHRFSGGLAWVRLEGRWGLLRRDGSMAVPPRFDEVRWKSTEMPYFAFDVEQVALGGRWGLVERSGDFVLPPTFGTIFDFHEGIARVADWDPDPDPDECVARPGRFGFIDSRGRVIVSPRFQSAGDFHDGRARAVLEGRAGHVDLDGLWTVDAT